MVYWILDFMVYCQQLPASPKFYSVSLYGCLFSRQWRCLGFPIYNGEFYIFEKTVIKNGKLEISKSTPFFCEEHWEENSGHVWLRFVGVVLTPIESHISEKENKIIKTSIFKIKKRMQFLRNDEKIWYFRRSLINFSAVFVEEVAFGKFQFRKSSKCILINYPKWP